MENKIQSSIIKYLKAKKCFVVKTIISNQSGIPDLLCCINGKFVAFEVKDIGKRPTELQKYKINEIIKSGGYAYVIDSVNEVKQIYELIFSHDSQINNTINHHNENLLQHDSYCEF